MPSWICSLDDVHCIAGVRKSFLVLCYHSTIPFGKSSCLGKIWYHGWENLATCLVWYHGKELLWYHGKDLLWYHGKELLWYHGKECAHLASSKLLASQPPSGTSMHCIGCIIIPHNNPLSHFKILTKYHQFFSASICN